LQERVASILSRSNHSLRLIVHNAYGKPCGRAFTL
jgi:hypothetical protein